MIKIRVVSPVWRLAKETVRLFVFSLLGLIGNLQEIVRLARVHGKTDNLPRRELWFGIQTVG